MQTPMAGDMRYLVSVLRVVPELERSGDLAEHIAQRAATGLAARLTPDGARAASSRWAAICVDLWRRAADAWAERDGDAAAALDAGRRPARRPARPARRRAAARASSRWPTPCRRTLVARFYERLGDHAVHITERVRYLADGS